MQKEIENLKKIEIEKQKVSRRKQRMVDTRRGDVLMEKIQKREDGDKDGRKQRMMENLEVEESKEKKEGNKQKS